ncbi:TonB-dependent receptor plug domain-containing protein [Pseudomonas sp. PhalM4]
MVGTSVIDQNNVDSFGSLTTVVGQEQIRDLNALDLSSALRRTPGVVVSRFNPVGSFGGAEGGAVYIRGMGASRPGSEIKTYIDGVPFYMGVWGHPLLDLLPINAMQSISVYKGPQPQKFGNTFAAIDLTPKVAEQGDNHHGELQLTGGSFRTATEQASLIGREGNFDYLLAQGAAHSDGDRSDGDGRLNNGMARLGYRLNDNWSTGLLVLHANNQVSDPGQKACQRPRTANSTPVAP